MFYKIKKFYSFSGHYYERLKFYLLTLAFSFLLGSYTIAKELKDSIFVNIVGKEYLPKAKLLVFFFLIPSALLYGYLIDRFRRYKVLSYYSFMYSLVIFIFAYLLGHTEYGLHNEVPSESRLLGWVYYFVLEGYSPFVVGVFWAFVNSVSNPKEAKNNYGIMVAGSKIGGMMSSLSAWYLLSNTHILSSLYLSTSDVVGHQLLLCIVAGMLLFVPIIIHILIYVVPGQHLHGYEAVYQLEKKKSKERAKLTGIFSGITVLIKNPYVLGIFGIVFFYETINVVINFQRIFLLKQAASSMAEFTASMFKQRFWMNFISMIISLFGLQVLVKRFGERLCLLIVPILIGLFLIGFLMNYSTEMVLWTFVALGAINYSFSHPIKESLYIPTVKDIKFKAKSWIDSFGAKFSKGFGSTFTHLSQNIIPTTSMFYFVYGLFFGVVILIWCIIAWYLGKKYEKAILHNEIIGNGLYGKEENNQINNNEEVL